MGNILKYLDNVVSIISAIAAFDSHRDPSTLARALAKELYVVVEEGLERDLSSTVDKQKLLTAVEAVVDVFEPLMGIAPAKVEPDVF
jgi:hypothetical protein